MCKIKKKAIALIRSSTMTAEQKLIAELFFEKLDKVENQCAINQGFVSFWKIALPVLFSGIGGTFVLFGQHFIK